MAAAGVNLSPGPIGKTAIIVVGGGLAGLAFGSLATAAAGEDSELPAQLAAAAAAAGVAYVVTGSAKAAALVGGLELALGVAGAAFLRAHPGSAGVAKVTGAIAGTVATYLVVR